MAYAIRRHVSHCSIHHSKHYPQQSAVNVTPLLIMLVAGSRIQPFDLQGKLPDILICAVVHILISIKAFYDLHIEDMWLPFFCNSTNINTSTMEIHETGYAWRFIRTCCIVYAEALIARSASKYIS